MPHIDQRLDAALAAMREPPPAVDHAVVERVAARAVLANAPVAHAAAWWMRAAAAMAIVALGATSLTMVRRASPERSVEADVAASLPTAAPFDAPTVTITPVVATGARPIVFELDAPAAQSVQVLGDFNQWSRSASSMARGADGRWRLTTMLPPGRYVYAYLVDGQHFQRDPARDAVEDRDFGVTGSELVVGEAP